MKEKIEWLKERKSEKKKKDNWRGRESGKVERKKETQIAKKKEGGRKSYDRK